MEAEIRFGNGVSILEQDKKNNSTGEWEFHIDIDSIRAQSQEDSADSLIAQLDQMAQQDGTPASEMEEGSLDEPAGETRVLPAAEQKQTSAADDVTSETDNCDPDRFTDRSPEQSFCNRQTGHQHPCGFVGWEGIHWPWELWYKTAAGKNFWQQISCRFCTGV